eukprot:TRINITY_DN60179_c0_g1_i1.p1 TRINITY_DN60179_c0_g1~~TRINITY_DN60179_c0_g1_i1.p1  ORF type:complete len:761 (+),score=180.54 TRINITY_DN60179_c0_g1_i1:66-2285(+)
MRAVRALAAACAAGLPWETAAAARSALRHGGAHPEAERIWFPEHHSLDPNTVAQLNVKQHNVDDVVGAEYARRYKLPSGREALVVTARKDGVHFFNVTSGADSLPAKYVGSWSPGLGELVSNASGVYEYREFSWAWRQWIAWSGAVVAALWLGFLASMFVLFVLHGLTECCPARCGWRCCEMLSEHFAAAHSPLHRREKSDKKPVDESTSTALKRAASPTGGLCRSFMLSGLVLSWLLVYVAGGGPPGTFVYEDVWWCAFYGFCMALVLFALFALFRFRVKRAHRFVVAIGVALFFIAFGYQAATQDVLVATEGQAAYENVLVVLSLCAGSEQVLPWQPSAWSFNLGLNIMGWAPCPQVNGVMTPTLFVFDLSKLDWDNPAPSYAVPLWTWGAALHVQLFTSPHHPRGHLQIPPDSQEGETEVLWASVTSGFSQGFPGVAGLGRAMVMALPIGYRPKGAAPAGGQTTTSFQKLGFEGESGAAFKINVTAALDARVQEDLTAYCPRAKYPEGDLLYQSGDHTYVLTAGVASGRMYVVDYFPTSRGNRPTVREVTARPNQSPHSHQAPHLTFDDGPPSDAPEPGWKQLVGRTFLQAGNLYAVTADFAGPGGVVTFNLSGSGAAGNPQRVGGNIHEATEKANRVVLVEREGRTWAVVPYEDVRRFGVYDVTDVTCPCLVALSEQAECFRTYCLEVFPADSTSAAMRVILFSSDGDMFVSEAVDFKKLSDDVGTPDKSKCHCS